MSKAVISLLLITIPTIVFSKQCDGIWKSVVAQASNSWCQNNCERLPQNSVCNGNDHWCECVTNAETHCVAVRTAVPSGWCDRNCYDGAGQLTQACDANNPDHTCRCTNSDPAPTTVTTPAPVNPINPSTCHSINTPATNDDWCNNNCKVHPDCATSCKNC